ncbi:hypothetical protein [Serratia marcescens]|uniref:hypothetical protein n=1 Tax=Serratia marcescens TaxID=615 RepID=UPI003F7F65CA
MDNKLSELSKPVMYSITCNGVVEEIGGDSQGFSREEVQAELDLWDAVVPGAYTVSALYSQEYVSALLAELKFEKQNNAGVAGMVEDYETKLEAKDKRIAELEAKLAMPVRLLGEMLSHEWERAERQAAFEHRKIAWDARLAEDKKAILAAGFTFTVEGDE